MTEATEQAPAGLVIEAELPVSLPDPNPPKVDEVAPKETDAKAAEEADESDKADEATEEDDNADDVEAEKPKRRSGVQRLKEQNRRLQAEIEAIRASATRAGGDARSAIEAEIGPAPREQDYSDYLAYERAMTAYTVKEAIAEERIRERAGQMNARQTERIRDLVEAYEDGQDAARKAIPDYDAALKSAKNAPVAPHVEGLILESDKSALIAYHLAKNPEKLERLNAMPPVAAAREIGRLEARLSLPSTNKATSAPKPVAPVKGGASPTPKITEMSMEEYAAARAKGWKG